MSNDSRKHPPPGRPQPPETARPHLEVPPPDSQRLTAQDHWHVDLAQPWEVTFWSREFGCSEEELRKAVEMVGTTAGHVRAWLRGEPSLAGNDDHNQQRYRP